MHKKRAIPHVIFMTFGTPSFKYMSTKPKRLIIDEIQLFARSFLKRYLNIHVIIATVYSYGDCFTDLKTIDHG